MSLHSAVVVDAVRSANGRVGDGALCHIRAEDLLARLFESLLDRNPKIGADMVEDVLVGCAFPEAEQGLNLGRRVALLAGFPNEVPGATINRFCASSAEATHMAARSIMAGAGDVFIVGGVENMSHVPLGGFHREQALHPELIARKLVWPMTQTAQNVHEEYGISRAEMDAFSARSQQRAARATRDGVFADEMIPLELPLSARGEDKDGSTRECMVFDKDENIRPETTLETLSQLEPLPDLTGSNGRSVQITAGNSCPFADGAAALLLMEENRARALGYSGYARVIGAAAAGVHPRVMGIGPVPATIKALRQATLDISDIHLVEMNEAFAAQAVASIRELAIDEKLVNPYGGAIALGHSPGQAGARILCTLFHELRRGGQRHGLATLCVSGGQGSATIIELVH